MLLSKRGLSELASVLVKTGPLDKKDQGDMSCKQAEAINTMFLKQYFLGIEIHCSFLLLSRNIQEKKLETSWEQHY